MKQFIALSFSVIFFLFPVLLNGQQYLTYTHGGLTRNYILYLPSNLPNDAPLVFMLHGYSGVAQGMMNHSGMNKLADKHKFAVCYPQGKPDQWDNNFWHVGYDFHQNETVDDVDFIISLADYLQRNYKLSKENTFCSGMSNGGDMSYMLACQASGVFKAAAPVAGCMMKWIYDSCTPERVLPIFATHGTEDDITYWYGDKNNVDGWGAYMGVEDAIEFWQLKNGTTDFSTENLPDHNPNDGSHIISEKHTKGMNNHEVWLYKTVGGGHDWPGAWGNMDVDISEEIWMFFEFVMSESTLNVHEMVGKENKLIQAFPNPARNVLTITTYRNTPLGVTILNTTGQQIMSGVVQNNGGTLDISTLPAGMYFLQSGNQVIKFLKSD